MNTALLPALGWALLLIVGVVVVLLLRRGRRAPPPPADTLPRQSPVVHQPVVQRAVAPAPSVAPTAPMPLQPGAAPAPTVAEIDARRQATTEALRLARQRKADEAARLEAGRAVQARAEAAARSAPRPAPVPPAAPRAPAGWASRPMDLGPAGPDRRRPVPAPVPAPVPVPTPLQRAAPLPAPAPAAVAPLPPVVPPVVPPVSPVLPSRPAMPAASARTPVVLVADDSKVVRVKTGRLLEKQGWQVLLADDGAAALALLDQHTPDLLITDVEMPGIDGFTLTRQVRGHARCARLPVIMITSSDERHRAEAQAAGVDLLLGKPYAEETLLAQAQRLLRVAPPVLH